MKNIILIIIFLIGACIFLINFRLSRLSYKANKAVSKKKLYDSRLTYAIKEKISQVILPHVKLSEEQHELQAVMMLAASIKGSPEEYLSKIISETLMVMAVGVLLFLVTNNSFIFILSIAFCYFNYLLKQQKLTKDYILIQQQVAQELPKLCGVISGKLSYTSSVENILKSYYPIANIAMKKQLDITFADMRTGDIVIALNRLESRLHLPRLSDICRGLVAIHNGNNQQLYFEIKANEITREYENAIEQVIVKRPGKLAVLQIAIFLLFLGCTFYPFFTYLINQFKL